MGDDKFVLIVGNLNEGFSIFGPFKSFDDADDYSRNFNQISWITKLIKPWKEVWGEETNGL